MQEIHEALQEDGEHQLGRAAPPNEIHGRLEADVDAARDEHDRAELTRHAIARAARILACPVDPQRVLVVGDTPKDIDAAHAVGAVAVGVASGHYDESELAEAGAAYVLGSLREELPGVAEVVR